MKPSIGRIVHFRMGADDILPGIITGVKSDEVVTLVLFSHYMHYNGLPYVDVQRGVAPGQWNWPDRV